MLSRKRQKKYFKKRWKALKAHLLAFFETINPEELHRMRVEIKKINALIIFLHDYSRKKTISDSFKPIKKIFKRAGLTRSAHVNLQFVEKYHLFHEEFKNEQNRNLVYQTGKFCQKRDEYLSLIKEAHKDISGNFRNINSKFILQVFEKQKNQLSWLFAIDNPEKKLHRCRKKIKFLLYLHHMLPKRIAGKLQVDTNYLSQLEESIGKWHDTVSAMELLKIKDYSDKAVLTQLEKQAQRTLHLINTRSSDFLEKVKGKK